jgi:hypothetical protein
MKEGQLIWVERRQERKTNRIIRRRKEVEVVGGEEGEVCLQRIDCRRFRIDRSKGNELLRRNDHDALREKRKVVRVMCYCIL